MSRIDLDSDSSVVGVSSEGRFHKTLVFFQIPAEWPFWKVSLALIGQTMIVAAVWWLAVSQFAVAIAAGLILAFFFASDGLLFRFLPVWNISYGPWQSQAIVLSLPRSVVAIVISILGLWAGSVWGLGLLVLVELIGSAALFYGALIEPVHLQLTNLEVTTDRLDPQSLPIRILHISDLHVERLTRRESQLLTLVEQAKPDLILITGDYLNLSYVLDPEAHAQVKSLLRQISAPHGVYATLGSPTVDERKVVPPLFDELPIRLLVNEWNVIELGDDRRIVLLGMDCSHHLATDRAKLEELSATAPNTMPNVLLYHAPDLMPEATHQGIDLYLCGHTHGGQVRLPGYGAILTGSYWGKRFEMGHYHDGRTHMYVSRGVGLEGLSAPRVRFLSPPEVTLVTMQGGSG